MVHAIHSSSRPAFRLHPDAKRVAGFAAAITLNLALLMLLLVPMQGPSALSLPDTGPHLTWILPTPRTPPPPPVPVPITTHQSTPHHPVPAPVPVNHESQQAIVDHAESQLLIAADEGTADTTPASNGAGPLLSGMTLEYADAPAPAYPRDALREGVEGVVMLQVLVDIDGRPLQVNIQGSSGDRRLDNAARKQVLQHWRFRAAMKDGRPVQAIGLVPIAFKLQ